MLPSNKIQYWKDVLDELELRVCRDQIIEVRKLYTWAADCVAVFSVLGVSNDIIRGFMNMFEDPVHNQDQAYKYWSNPANVEHRIKGFFYPNVAFTTARALIDRIAEDERLVPQTLISLLKKDPAHNHLVTSLESMQSSYEVNDIQNLLASTTGLLQSIINLDPNMLSMDKAGLKAQLTYISDKKNIATLANYGVDAELMEMFHNFRYLRNVVSQHKKTGAFQPPLSVGYGYASLVLQLIYKVVARGVLIKI